MTASGSPGGPRTSSSPPTRRPAPATPRYAPRRGRGGGGAPHGADRGAETVTLLNTTAAPVDLAGWALVDAAGGHQTLAGTVAAGDTVRVTLGGAVALGNTGDALTLVDAKGTTVDRVSYSAGQVRPGRTVVFGR